MSSSVYMLLFSLTHSMATFSLSYVDPVDLRICLHHSLLALLASLYSSFVAFRPAPAFTIHHLPAPHPRPLSRSLSFPVVILVTLLHPRAAGPTVASSYSAAQQTVQLGDLLYPFHQLPLPTRSFAGHTRARRAAAPLLATTPLVVMPGAP